jgi:hypothetical protein
MNLNKKLLTIGSVAAVAAFGFGIPSGAATTTSPSHQTHAAAVSHVVKTKKVKFVGTYKGKLGLLMIGTAGGTASSVKVTSITGTGTGTLLGKSTVSGTGSAPAGSQTDPITGKGVLSGGGSKLMLTAVTSKSFGTAAGTATPTSVSVSGVAKVTGGTGKYKGATGNLTFKGSFTVQSNNAGTSESDAFTATLSGTLTIKS